MAVRVAERVPTEYDYFCVHHTALGRSSMLDISSVGVVPAPRKNGRWQHLADIFAKAYRSVLALPPSWLSSNRAWKATPGDTVCDVHRPML